jgi:hypothetical protein
LVTNPTKAYRNGGRVDSMIAIEEIVDPEIDVLVRDLIAMIVAPIVK